MIKAIVPKKEEAISEREKSNNNRKYKIWDLSVDKKMQLQEEIKKTWDKTMRKTTVTVLALWKKD